MIPDFFEFAYISMTDFQKEKIEVKYDLVKHVRESEKTIEDAIYEFSISGMNTFRNDSTTLHDWYYDYAKKEKEFKK